MEKSWVGEDQAGTEANEPKKQPQMQGHKPHVQPRCS